jgi:hypothetical protein
MPELGELYLELAVERPGALGEDIQDEARPVQHPALHKPFQVTLLSWAEAVVEEHQLALVGHQGVADLLGLSATDEQPGVGNGPGGPHQAYGLGASGSHKLQKFANLLLVFSRPEVDVYEDGTVATLRSLKQSRNGSGQSDGISDAGEHAGGPQQGAASPAAGVIAGGDGPLGGT